ncbi:hypothetical protein ONZ43_g2329 [Nemania bipapillata]|uniref:Uncharacterized protein n=1 Tax=Nemania bipapillata TaxID=110536 RepID=A0ACC2J105_9PEZI|nr:hypothetical protein ONZ43_g2329 [Nemania bipapillata]
MATDDDPAPAVPFNRDEPQWPMTFTLKPPDPRSTIPRRWWNHNYYSGPEGETIQVLYSKAKSSSEKIAKQFVDEPVLGFDMEWPWDAEKRPKLKDKVALIQVASERKVGLFHISLHEGDTVDDLIAPSLKEIIESPRIIKTGVAILRADFGRLKTHLQLDPKGAFELSHLHNLVTFGSTTPQKVTTRLQKLSLQVQQHLGLPLWKGDVRTSDWSRPLNQSQIKYAATDAYASFMLFHCMNAKRLAMDPAPPFPRFAEAYVTSPPPRSTSVQLESELLRVPGIGKGKSAEYGAAWLEIIAQFVADYAQDDNQEGQEASAELEGPDPKRRKLEHDGGSSEEVLVPSHEPAPISSADLAPQPNQTAPVSEPPTLPQPIMLADSDQYDGDSVFDPPMDLPPPSALKRKREDTTTSPGPEGQRNTLPTAFK